MSRKEELLKMAHLLRLQAESMNSRDAKQAFQKMANYYQHEAEQLLERPVLVTRRKQARFTKSAA